MNKTCVTLTIFFEDPFWVGLFERTEENTLKVCKVTFGAEPKDGEVYDYILREYDRLAFSPGVASSSHHPADNPKRRQRNAGKQLRQAGIGTKSQQALQMQREAMKTERRTVRKEELEAEKQRRFLQKQQKKKEKHKGH